jgi:hypothetical protein
MCVKLCRRVSEHVPSAIDRHEVQCSRIIRERSISRWLSFRRDNGEPQHRDPIRPALIMGLRAHDPHEQPTHAAKTRWAGELDRQSVRLTVRRRRQETDRRRGIRTRQLHRSYERVRLGRCRAGASAVGGTRAADQEPQEAGAYETGHKIGCVREDNILRRRSLSAFRGSESVAQPPQLGGEEAHPCPQSLPPIPAV